MLGAASDRGILLERAALAGEQANGFGQVHGRTTTECDEAIGISGIVLLCDSDRLIFCWVGDRVCENGGGLHAEIFQDSVQQTNGFDARICDHHWTGNAKSCQGRSELGNRAMVKNASGQKIHDGHGGVSKLVIYLSDA